MQYTVREGTIYIHFIQCNERKVFQSVKTKPIAVNEYFLIWSRDKFVFLFFFKTAISVDRQCEVLKQIAISIKPFRRI